jgi:urea transport system ATP-binding protein
VTALNDRCEKEATVLELDKLNQFYGESHTLWDISMQVPEGGCMCLMGRNGVGKTTLLKSVMGSVPATGAVRFGGKNLLDFPQWERARSGIGLVPQGREIFGQLTVEENLLVGSAGSKNKNGIPARIFELFPVLKEMLRRRGGDLSGGQQQQLAIGRALMSDPKLLILDEPTEGIQPNIVRQIGDILVKLNEEEGLAILLVEQKLPFARRVAKQFVILDRGRSVATGQMSELTDEIVDRYLVV